MPTWNLTYMGPIPEDASDCLQVQFYSTPHYNLGKTSADNHITSGNVKFELFKKFYHLFLSVYL